MAKRFIKDIRFFKLDNSSLLSSLQKRSAILQKFNSFAKNTKLSEQLKISEKTATQNLQYILDKPSFPNISGLSPDTWNSKLKSFIEELSNKKDFFLNREAPKEKKSFFEELFQIYKTCSNSNDFEVKQTRNTALCALIAFSISSASLSLLLKVVCLLMDLVEENEEIDLEMVENFFGILGKFDADCGLSVPISGLKDIEKSNMIVGLFVWLNFVIN
ncbi:hypothetical protein MHBO_004753 [Bonamia ostreae]|uniref:Uncharacterized protein n=1 Tax=Bonamia ostreae TaxID=126728 RepID=A0ABV2AU52_9EUKA